MILTMTTTMTTMRGAFISAAFAMPGHSNGKGVVHDATVTSRRCQRQRQRAISTLYHNCTSPCPTLALLLRPTTTAAAAVVWGRQLWLCARNVAFRVSSKSGTRRALGTEGMVSIFLLGKMSMYR
jgi:hypothetical protein